MTEARVLLIDDSRAIRESLGPFLLGLLPDGAEFRAVGNVEDALRALPNFRPNLVFLDLDLHSELSPELARDAPGLSNGFTGFYGVDGDDLLTYLHARCPGAGIVICTAWDYDEERVRRAGQAPGVVGVLTKPIKEPDVRILLQGAGLLPPRAPA